MVVQELIDLLMEIEDKTLSVLVMDGFTRVTELDGVTEGMVTEQFDFTTDEDRGVEDVILLYI